MTNGFAANQLGVQWRTIPLTHGVHWSTRFAQTVVETPTYLAVANKLFRKEESADIVALVSLSDSRASERSDERSGKPRVNDWNRKIFKVRDVTGCQRGMVSEHDTSNHRIA
jgi:hypothetical protein